MFRAPNTARLMRRRDVDRLIAALDWPRNETVREAAARALGAVGDDRAVSPLLTAIASGSVPVVGAATVALDELDERGHRVAATGFIDALRRQPWPPLSYRTSAEVERRVRTGYDIAGEHAQALLRRRADASDIPALAELLADGRVPFAVQSAAITGLASTGEPTAVSPLVQQLQRQQARGLKLPHPLASETFLALASLQDPSTVDVLARWLCERESVTIREIEAFSAVPSATVEHLQTLIVDRTDPVALKLLSAAA